VIAARVLRADAVALTLQNGIGNVEILVAELGPGRVLGGSTMCSFRSVAPGVVEQTNVAATTIGALDGSIGGRVLAVRDLLRGAGYPTEASPEIMAVIWQKLVVNIAINPICGITGLRMGELARLAATDRYQDLLLEEALAVGRAKGLNLPEAALREKIKAHCWDKYSKPSMLQHLEAGRRTEIDALNGALVREAAALGVPVPYNDAIAMLIAGRQLHEHRRAHEPRLDYAALEAAATEPRP
jgi:2-dehydropantoate 2-reductase